MPHHGKIKSNRSFFPLQTAQKQEERRRARFRETRCGRTERQAFRSVPRTVRPEQTAAPPERDDDHFSSGPSDQRPLAVSVLFFMLFQFFPRIVFMRDGDHDQQFDQRKTMMRGTAGKGRMLHSAAGFAHHRIILERAAPLISSSGPGRRTSCRRRVRSSSCCR